MNLLCAITFALMLLAEPELLLAVDATEVVGSSAALDPRQPQAAVDEHGTICVAFGSKDSIYVCTSRDRGKTYGEPVALGSVPRLALGMRRGPRIVAGKGVAVVSAIGHEDGNLRAWHSRDGGRTWSDEVLVNDSPGHAAEGLHAIAIGPAGQLYCVWLDHRNKATQIFGASSTDGGKTWSKNQLIYASPTGNVCECCHPSVKYAAGGDLYVMWRNSLAGHRDMYFAVSRDGGGRFSDARKLGQGSWKLDACPMDGGCLAVSAKGEMTTVWRREQQVFCTESDDRSETLLGPGQQPWTAASADGAYFVWLGERPGTLWLRAPAAEQPVALATHASDPMVAAPIGGKGPVVVVWEAVEQEQKSIRAAVVSGGELRFSFP